MPYKKNTTKQNNEQDNTKKKNNERANTKEIRQAYISKHNDEGDNQVNLLMITDGTSNWHHLAINTYLDY